MAPRIMLGNAGWECDWATDLLLGIASGPPLDKPGCLLRKARSFPPQTVATFRDLAGPLAPVEGCGQKCGLHLCLALREPGERVGCLGPDLWTSPW